MVYGQYSALGGSSQAIMGRGKAWPRSSKGKAGLASQGRKNRLHAFLIGKTGLKNELFAKPLLRLALDFPCIAFADDQDKLPDVGLNLE